MKELIVYIFINLLYFSKILISGKFKKFRINYLKLEGLMEEVSQSVQQKLINFLLKPSLLCTHHLLSSVSTWLKLRQVLVARGNLPIAPACPAHATEAWERRLGELPKTSAPRHRIVMPASHCRISSSAYRASRSAHRSLKSRQDYIVSIHSQLSITLFSLSLSLSFLH